MSRKTNGARSHALAKPGKKNVGKVQKGAHVECGEGRRGILNKAKKVKGLIP